MAQRNETLELVYLDFPTNTTLKEIASIKTEGVIIFAENMDTSTFQIGF